MFRGKKFQLVELIITVQITKNNSNIYFQEQPGLASITQDKNTIVRAIVCYSSTGVAVSPLTSGNNVALPSDLANATVTFVVNAKEDLKRIPLCDFNHIINDTPSVMVTQQLKALSGISWTESYVTVVTAPPITPFSYLFGVWYDNDDDL